MARQLALLAAAPVMGALFVIFLPLVGFAIVGSALIWKAADALDRKLATA